jgi:hypothetical protein
LPEQTELSLPVNSNIDFEVVPFVLGDDDTLRFNWWLDGEHLDFDSTTSAMSVEFGELGQHVMMCVLTDTCDADTVTWFLNVYDPNSAVIPSDDYLPQEVALHPPSPNPFNASATVRYDLPASGWVKLSLYDLSGRLVVTLVDGEKPAGRHAVELDGSGLAAGVYFVRLVAVTSPQVTALKNGRARMPTPPDRALIQKAMIVK